jgi:hypothetical protein
VKPSNSPKHAYLPLNVQTAIHLKNLAKQHPPYEDFTDWFTELHILFKITREHRMCKTVLLGLPNETVVVFCQSNEITPITVLAYLGSVELSPAEIEGATYHSVYMEVVLKNHDRVRFFIDNSLANCKLLLRYTISRTLEIAVVDFIKHLERFAVCSYVDIRRTFDEMALSNAPFHIRKQNTKAVLDSLRLSRSLTEKSISLTLPTKSKVYNIQKSIKETVESMGYVSEVLRQRIVSDFATSTESMVIHSLEPFIEWIMNGLQLSEEEGKRGVSQLIRHLVGDFKGFETAEDSVEHWDSVCIRCSSTFSYLQIDAVSRMICWIHLAVRAPKYDKHAFFLSAEYLRNKISALKSLSSPSDITKTKTMLYERFQAQDTDLAFVVLQFFVYADRLRPLDQNTEFHNWNHPVLELELDMKGTIKDIDQIDDIVNDAGGRLTLVEGGEAKASWNRIDLILVN